MSVVIAVIFSFNLFRFGSSFQKFNVRSVDLHKPLTCGIRSKRGRTLAAKTQVLIADCDST